MVVCKCGHPSYVHNETSGKCEVVIQRLKKVVKLSDDGRSGFVIETEIFANCDCTRLQDSNRRRLSGQQTLV